MLDTMGGIPPAQTVDYVKGVSHYNEGMMNSDAGIDKVGAFPKLDGVTTNSSVPAIPCQLQRLRRPERS